MTIYDRLRNLLTLYASIPAPTVRQDAAFDFAWKQLWLSATQYGRMAYLDFRIQSARSRYLIARKLEDWPRARRVA